MPSSIACPGQRCQVLECGCSCKQGTTYDERSFLKGERRMVLFLYRIQNMRVTWYNSWKHSIATQPSVSKGIFFKKWLMKTSMFKCCHALCPMRKQSISKTSQLGASKMPLTPRMFVASNILCVFLVKGNWKDNKNQETKCHKILWK